MPVANGFAGINRVALEADPETKADVDFMILDYLASIAAERVLCSADNPSLETKEEADWLIDSVRGELLGQQLHSRTLRPDTAVSVPNPCGHSPLRHPPPPGCGCQTTNPSSGRCASGLHVYTHVPISREISSAVEHRS